MHLCFDNVRKNLEEFDINKVRKVFLNINTKVEALEKLQQHTYLNKSLAAMSLLHRSVLVHWPNDKQGIISNERLEFLGDAFLNFYIAIESMARFPGWQEGELSKLRAALVGADYLAKKTKEIGLGKFLVLGKSESSQAEANRDNIFADAFEAITAALLIDAGEEYTWKWLNTIFDNDFNLSENILSRFDAKSRFQQWVQGIVGVPPVYKVIGSQGTPSSKTEFIVAMFIGNTEIARAAAVNRRVASKIIATKLMESVAQGTLTEETIRNAIKVES